MIPLESGYVVWVRYFGGKTFYIDFQDVDYYATLYHWERARKRYDVANCYMLMIGEDVWKHHRVMGRA